MIGAQSFTHLSPRRDQVPIYYSRDLADNNSGGRVGAGWSGGWCCGWVPGRLARWKRDPRRTEREEMVDPFVEPRRRQQAGHDFAEIGLIVALVGTMVASASITVSDKLLALWTALAAGLGL